MPLDKSIFGLRFGSVEHIQPSPEELSAFYEKARQEKSDTFPVNDLSSYRTLLADLQTFAVSRLSELERQDIRELMYYGVLGHSRFVSSALLTAVEQYQFHLQPLLAMDFKKPSAFVRFAHEELRRLDRKIPGELAKSERLRKLVDERKEVLDELSNRWHDLSAELRHIAQYVGENLIRIQKLSEASVVILNEFEAQRLKEKELINDIKTSFKERLKDALRAGSLTKQELEKARRDMDLIALELSAIIRDDGAALKKLYEDIRDHMQKTLNGIDLSLKELETKKNADPEESKDQYASIGRYLVNLLTEHHFKLKTSGIRTSAAHQDVIMGKRQELFNYLFGQVRMERRSRADRRVHRDRRKFDELDGAGEERRTDRERRSGTDRRKS
jgi:hypothetical protein